MSNLYLKKPLYKSVSEFTDLSIQNYDALKGKIFPVRVVSVSGAFVTVAIQVESDTAFPLIKMPVIGSEYIQTPILPGMTGVAIPADFSLGGITGLGLGVALDLQPPNLSAMFFVPIGNLSYPTSLPGVTTISGPSGVALQDATGVSSFKLTSLGMIFTIGTSTITITPTSITLSSGSMTIVLSSSGVTINGISFSTHTHSVTTAPGTTGVPA